MKKHVFNIIICVLTSLLLAGCEVELEEAPKGSIYCTGTVDAQGINTTGFKVSSLLESTNLGHGRFTVQSFDCDLPQIIFVSNAEGNPVLLYRDLIPKKGTIEINAQTTAIAYLTFSPDLGTVYGDDYKELIEIITSAKNYEKYLAEVTKSIAENRDIYDTTNIQLIDAAKAVYTELLGDTSRLFYDGSKDLSFYTYMYGCWPIDVRPAGNKLNFRLPALCPSYWCTVFDSNHSPTGEKFVLPSRENVSTLNLIKCIMGQSDWLYGEQVSYTFPKTNTQKVFFFDRSNTAGQIDKWLQIAGCVLQIIGVPSNPIIIKTVAESLSYAIPTAITMLESGNFQEHIWTFLPLIIKTTLNILSDPKSNSYMANFIGYYAIEIQEAMERIAPWERALGCANLITRTIWNCICESSYTFCGEYYPDGSFGLCTSIFLNIIEGNHILGQTGQPYDIVISVASGNSDMNYDNYKIKFVTNSGCGSIDPELDGNVYYHTGHLQYVASGTWYLGDQATQQARAILIDKTTNKEIESIDLSATLIQNLWQIGVRCEWASSYLFQFQLNENETSFGPTTAYGNDYDGKGEYFIYTGTVQNNRLHLTVAAYTTSDNHHFRTDEHTVYLTNDHNTCYGVLTYDDDAGCTNALDADRISGGKEARHIILNDSTSHTSNCANRRL